MYDELYAAGLTEIVGATEIVGGLPQYAAGALPQYAAGAQQAYGHYRHAHPHAGHLPPAPSTVAYGSKIGVHEFTGTRPRLYPLGFNESGILASASSTVTSRPQIPFRPQRLVLPSTVGSDDIAVNFVLSEIRVGKDSQLAQATLLPGIIFVETAVGIMMTLDTGQPANDIALSATNADTGGTHDFWAVMFGAAVDR
jgi:hypothetical protein